MSKQLVLDSAPHGEAEGWRKGEDLIDALPYIDTLSAEMKKDVDRLIQEEAARSVKQPIDYLRELPPVPPPTFKGSRVLATEFERVKRGDPLAPLDTLRYALAPPPSNRQNDVGQWKKAIDNAHAQLEHQHLRLLNLELQLKYGAGVWRLANDQGEGVKKDLENELNKVKNEIKEVNQRRKLSQETAGKQLKELEEKWHTLVRKNFEIENVCGKLEKEISELNQQAGERLETEENSNKMEVDVIESS